MSSSEFEFRAELVKLENLGPTWAFAVIARNYIICVQILTEALIRNHDEDDSDLTDDILSEILKQIDNLRRSIVHWIQAWSEVNVVVSLNNRLATISSFHKLRVLSHLGRVYASIENDQTFYRICSLVDCIGARLHEDHVTALSRLITDLGPMTSAKLYVTWTRWVMKAMIGNDSFAGMIDVAKGLIASNQIACDGPICRAASHTSYYVPCPCLRGKIFAKYERWVFAYCQFWLTGSASRSFRWYWATKFGIGVSDTRIFTERLDFDFATKIVVPMLARIPRFCRPHLFAKPLQNNQCEQAFASPFGTVVVKTTVTLRNPTYLAQKDTEFFRIQRGTSKTQTFVAIQKEVKPSVRVFCRPKSRTIQKYVRGIPDSGPTERYRTAPGREDEDRASARRRV